MAIKEGQPFRHDERVQDPYRRRLVQLGGLALIAFAVDAACGIPQSPQQPTPTGRGGAVFLPEVGKGAPLPPATPEPTAVPPEPTATPRAVKEIPSVITPESLKEAGREWVTWSPAETEKARTEASEQGQIKIPLPEVTFEKGVQVQSPPKKDGLLITDLDPSKEVVFPALISGKVVKAGRSSAKANIVRIEGSDGRKLMILFPLNGSTILIEQGMQVKADQVVFKARYDEGFSNSFPAYRGIQNIFVAIGMSNSDDSLATLDQNNIMTDSAGNIVTIVPPGK